MRNHRRWYGTTDWAAEVYSCILSLLVPWRRLRMADPSAGRLRGAKGEKSSPTTVVPPDLTRRRSAWNGCSGWWTGGNESTTARNRSHSECSWNINGKNASPSISHLQWILEISCLCLESLAAPMLFPQNQSMQVPRKSPDLRLRQCIENELNDKCYEWKPYENLTFVPSWRIRFIFHHKAHPVTVSTRIARYRLLSRRRLEILSKNNYNQTDTDYACRTYK